MAFRIGLTGGIGCGKSAVGAMLRELGADYLDADQVVHGLLATGSPLVDQVTARFGPAVQAADGGIDRRKLAAIVFDDPSALRDLEALLHPAVRGIVRQRLAASSAAAVVVDAIKLIEGGLHREMDQVWVVTCPPAEQLRRLTEQRGMSDAEARARLASQPPQESRLAYADLVIDNGGPLEATREQVRRAWAEAAGATIPS
jgi:dephospho-CoA kinase